METLLKGKQIDLKREEFTGLSNSKPNKPRTQLPTTPERLPGHRAAPFPPQRDWLAPGWDPRKITQDKWRTMWVLTTAAPQTAPRQLRLPNTFWSGVTEEGMNTV